MSDALQQALNAPSGRLAEILMKRMKKGENGEEISESVRTRLDKLVSARGNFGALARVRLAAEVALLYERAPSWTKKNLLPLLDWSSPEALNVWTARKYSTYIGSPQLFSLTKESFLELFGRSEVTDDDLRVYGDWLALMVIAN